MLCHSNPYLLTLEQKQKLQTANSIRDATYFLSWLPFHFSYFSPQVKILLLFLGYWSSAQRATTMHGEVWLHATARHALVVGVSVHIHHSSITRPRSPGVRITLFTFLEDHREIPREHTGTFSKDFFSQGAVI